MNGLEQSALNLWEQTHLLVTHPGFSHTVDTLIIAGTVLISVLYIGRRLKKIERALKK